MSPTVLLQPLALRAGLLVEAALPQLGVESRPLDLALEAAQGPLEAFVLLNDDFQLTTQVALSEPVSTIVTDNRRIIEDKYDDVIAALYDGSKDVSTETEVTYEDGRKGSISATLEVRDVKTFDRAAAKAA